jgi:hypothetical protein
MKRTFFTLLVSLLCLGNPVYAGDFMNGDEVKALLSGKTVTGKGLKKDFTVVTYFSPDGTMLGTKDGESRNGTWTVEDDGKQCIKFDDGNSNCRYIKDNGDGTYTKIKVKKNGKEIPLLLYESVQDGNNT